MKLGEVLRGYRDANRYGVREMARIIGTSAATLNRIERGEAAHSGTLAKILIWLLSNGDK